MAAGEDRADIRLLEQVALDAADEEVLLADDERHVPCADAQHANVGAADRAGQLDAGIDRHLLPAEETDLPAEERIDVGAGRRDAARRLRPGAGKVEDTRALQEERALLRKQHGEPRQVDLARIDFRLTEIGVEGCGQLQAGRDVVEHVEAGLSAGIVVALGAQPSSRDKRPDVQADALRQARQVGDLARLGQLIELRAEACAGPSILLQLAVDIPGDVEAPHHAVGREAQGLERNRELRGPSLVCALRAHVPDGVPVGIQLTTGDQAVHQRAGWIGREVEGAPLIAKRVEQNLDAIVGGQAGIARHLRADHPLRLRVVRDYADVEVITVVEERDVGAFRGRPALLGLALRQRTNRRGGTPDRLVQHAVDRDHIRRRRHDGRLGRGVRECGLLACGGGGAGRWHGQPRRQTGRGKRHEARHRGCRKVYQPVSRSPCVRWRQSVASRTLGLSHEANLSTSPYPISTAS